MSWNILPMVQRHDDAYIIQVYGGPPRKFGYSRCTRMRILACGIRDFAVPIHSMILNDGHHTSVETVIHAQLDHYSFFFITFDQKNISKIRSDAEALALFSKEPVRVDPKNAFEKIIRFPIHYFPPF